MERGSAWGSKPGGPSSVPVYSLVGPAGDEALPLQAQQQQSRRGKRRATNEGPPLAAGSSAGSPGGGGGGERGHTLLLEESSKDLGEVSVRGCLTNEPLLLLTLVGVACGITLGLLLRLAQPGEVSIQLIGFPGELMLRLLKLLVLPLVAVSMVSGICSLQRSGGEAVGRLARLTFAYYAGSTFAAILLGLLLVALIQPGRNAPLDSLATAAAGCHNAAKNSAATGAAAAAAAQGVSTAEALMRVGREVVPDNIVGAAVDLNILGVITFSLMLGVALSTLGPAAEGVIQAVGVLNQAVGKMVTAALWTSPLGIGSLIAASILRACDLLGTLSALALWAATVVLGLALFALLLLPALLFFVTGRSPLRVARAYAQSLIMAFGTSSSAASLPLAMQTSLDLGCEEGTVSFFLPLGITINLSGTALYEATTAVFIAQAHGVHLGVAGLFVVAFTASLAAVGAPAIPSAGLVTMLIVLQAVNLGQYASDLAVILAVDFVLDRLRTAVNVLSDAFGCIIVDHLSSGKGGGGGGGAGGNGVLHNSSSRGGGGGERGGGGLLRSSSSGPDPEGDFVAGAGEGRGGGGAGLLPGWRPPGGYVQLQEVHSTV